MDMLQVVEAQHARVDVRSRERINVAVGSANLALGCYDSLERRVKWRFA